MRRSARLGRTSSHVVTRHCGELDLSKMMFEIVSIFGLHPGAYPAILSHPWMPSSSDRLLRSSLGATPRALKALR